MKTWSIIILVAAALFSARCVPLYPAEQGSSDLFAPLRDADLASFQHQITIDHHQGSNHSWTELAQAFLDLAICDPIEPPTPTLQDEPQAHLLHTLTALEEARRLRLIAQARHLQQRSWHHNTVLVQFTSRSFFLRQPSQVDDKDLIRWPNPQDNWQDEWPAPTDVPYRCEDLGELARAPLPEYLKKEWALTEQALHLSQSSSIPDELRQQTQITLTLHRADLALLVYELDLDDLHQLDLPLQKAADELQALATLAADDENLSQTIAIRLSTLAIALDDPELTIDAFLPLLKHPNPQVAHTARYLIVHTAWPQGWWEVVTEYASPLPQKSSPLYNAQAYFAATAHLYLNEDDRFLAIARQALQDRPRDDKDPFLGALYRESLQFLTRFDPDPRIEELLEEFGPRSQLKERKKELATIALDLGRPNLARTLIEPILEKTKDARALPELQAILALASFFEDDPPQFSHHLDHIAPRPQWADELIPRARQPRFFAHQDRELARVLRATLPLMAEWGDDEHAHNRRQSWLKLIVHKTQQFLRWAPESVVSDDLNSLYRLASELLEESARGYASQIGAQDHPTSALILGTVGLPGIPPLEKAPKPRLRWAPIHSLLLIPADETPPTQFISQIPQKKQEAHQ